MVSYAPRRGKVDDDDDVHPCVLGRAGRAGRADAASLMLDHLGLGERGLARETRRAAPRRDRFLLDRPLDRRPLGHPLALGHPLGLAMRDTRERAPTAGSDVAYRQLPIVVAIVVAKGWVGPAIFAPGRLAQHDPCGARLANPDEVPLLEAGGPIIRGDGVVCSCFALPLPAPHVPPPPTPFLPPSLLSHPPLTLSPSFTYTP